MKYLAFIIGGLILLIGKRINRTIKVDLAIIFKFNDMKNLILTLFASIFLSSLSFGQTKDEMNAQYEQYRVKFAQSMVSFVNTLEEVYVRGESYDDFKKKAAPITITTDAEKVLSKAYDYLSSSRSDQFILDNESGHEIMKLTVAYAQSSRTISFEEFALGSDYDQGNYQAFKINWGKIWNGFKEVAEWTFEHIDDIIIIVRLFL